MEAGVEEGVGEDVGAVLAEADMGAGVGEVKSREASKAWVEATNSGTITIRMRNEGLLIA